MVPTLDDLRRGGLCGLLLSGVLGACTAGEVPLEGKACPCAPGWFCDPVDDVCVRSESERDAGAALDSGERADDGAAPRDALAAMQDASTSADGGADAGELDAGDPDAGVVRSLAVQVARSTDDAEECVEGTGSSNPDGPGSIYIGSSDLELVTATDATYCAGLQLIGLRFDNVSLPAGAPVVEAYLELTVDETNEELTSLTLSAEASDAAATFTTTRYDLSSRPRGSARVDWSELPAWDTVGDSVRSPDLSALLSEVAARPGWASGNAVVLFIEGSGKRVAESYDGSAALAPVLRLSYVE